MNTELYSQAHLSQLILQGQQQVRQRAQVLRRWPRPGGLGRWRGCGQGLTQASAGPATHLVQGVHAVAQLGLMVLHHVQQTLHVAAHRVASAGGLQQIHNKGEMRADARTDII